MKKRFFIGDKVLLDKEMILQRIGFIPGWYSEEIYTVTSVFFDSGAIMVKLDRKLPHNCSSIFMHYLKSDIKDERKNKLLKLNNV